MSNGILKCKGMTIVDGDDKEVILKGTCVGGHLNMENFITGYTGHEYEMREAMLKVLGQEKYDFFFDRMIENYFTDDDAKFLASLNLNCIRLPFNYRHFFDDENPEVIKAKGFAHLDRIVNVCAKYGIYTILDSHTMPGGQNQDWHCDSGIHKALFWEFKEFQDRAVRLWEALATHYKGNAWVAGYNPLNEPADPKHTRLIAYYDRIEKVIRDIDPDHILFLDGNTYAGDFTHFTKPLPNSVYSIHDYTYYGFPGYTQYTGAPEDDAKLQHQYDRKVEFMKEHQVPVCNGEFGPVYASAADDVEWEKTNDGRYGMLNSQLRIYGADRISWTIWCYKDIGLQGMCYLSEDSAYLKLIKPFVDRARKLGLAFWCRDDKAVAEFYEPLYKHVEAEIVPEGKRRARYPGLWDVRRQIDRVVREMLLSEYLVEDYAILFKDKSFEELGELADSFKFEQCVQREGLNGVLKADASQP